MRPNKDRAVAGSQLHTNFALAADGEYLALVEPNGETVASEIAPEFPPQYEDVSYGNSASSTDTTLIELGDGAQVLVPANGSLGTTWVNPGFVPNPPWQTGPLGVGYDAAEGPPPSTTVLQVDFNDRDNAGNTQPGFSSFVINGTTNIQTGPVTRSFGGDQCHAGRCIRRSGTTTAAESHLRIPARLPMRSCCRTSSSRVPTRAPAEWM